MRPDDLAAQIVRAALDKVPALDPTDIDDLMLGCGLPGGEQGYNMARVVAVLLGHDTLPGTTITRYCSSSLQTTRMALHAIRAGEGDVFISAGVETVSRFAKGNSDSLPDTHNPLFADARGRTAAGRRSSGARPSGSDPREDGTAPRHLHRDGPDRRERGAGSRASRREDMDEFAVALAEPRREGDRRTASGRGRSRR